MPISLSDPWPIPDSNICKQATALVETLSPPFLLNHCVRTYLLGQQLGDTTGLKPDLELLYLSAILHDLGLTDTYIGTQRFEVEGADAAAQFLKAQGMSEERAEVVWDAISLHTSLGIASRKRPEIALVHLGASMDVFGMGLEKMEPETVERIMSDYPRLKLTDELTKCFVEQIHRKPQTVPFTWLAEVGRCCIHGFSCPSYQDLANNSPFDE